MSPVIICIIIFFWIFIIIVAMSTKEKPEPEPEEYNTEKAVPITSPEIFFNFCDLIFYRVPSDLRAEVTNYLYILCEN